METLGAYSTIRLARALPDAGEMLTPEINQKHAEVSRRDLERVSKTGQNSPTQSGFKALP